MLTLITGGVSNGKSAFAENFACNLPAPRIYIATMEVVDEECRKRVVLHRERRANRGFATLECPRGLPTAPEGATVMLECVTTLTANALFSQATPATAEDISNCILSLCSGHAVVVTNEIATDGNIYDKYTSHYVDVINQVNRTLAAHANNVFEVVCGIPIVLKGSLYNYKG